MVLWEITLGTAYFLGLKRTYRLALRIQRRIISPKHPRVRQFVQRRTRSIFDVALRVHKNIQQRDLEMGRSVGNWILRWLDKMKPAAEIRPPPGRLHPGGKTNTNMTKQLTDSSHAKNSGTTQMPRNNDSNRHLFTSSKIMWPKSLTAAAKMMQPTRSSGFMTQYRHLYTSEPNVAMLNYSRGGSEGFIRKDIVQWMARN